VNGEAGAITQAIGASIIPLETIRGICGDLLGKLGMELTIPGLLFIDTPGHEAFASLRKRGGNLADIAIVVIDINDGFKPQTIESLELLKASKTPFIIAANKIDLINGWQTQEGTLLEKVEKQSEGVRKQLDEKLYTLVGSLAEHGFNGDRFDRVSDFTNQIGIVPVSAHTKDGMSELLMVITGLAQKFLEKGLEFTKDGPAKGSIMEVKEVKGIGKALDVIIYDGTLRKGDEIVIGGVDGAIVRRVKALLEPDALGEMRDSKTGFKQVESVVAATGVRISAQDVDEVTSGMPIQGVVGDVETVKNAIQEEVDEVVIETEGQGVVVKADSLGSLEALITLLKEQGITIKRASVGNITKKDLADAEANREDEPLFAAVLGFNVESVEHPSVEVIVRDVIYKIIEDFATWQKETKAKLETGKLGEVVRPCKLEVLKGYVFRQSGPAVCGVSIEAGTLHNNIPVMKEQGVALTKVNGIQHEQKNIEKAERGKQVAISMDGITIGRQISEGDILFSAVPEDDFKKMKDLKEYLSVEEKEIMKEIGVIMRKSNPVWGV
jgi:translation initiation factor 5B